MTSGGPELTEGLNQDLHLEELDFSDLFLYNQHEEDFPAGFDGDDLGLLPQRDTQLPLLVVEHHSSFISTASHSTSTDHLSWMAFDSMGSTARPELIFSPSPRIEITPSSESLNSQTFAWSPGSSGLGAYRDCISPASSNSSTGWTAEAFSPSASPCISPSNKSMELSTIDFSPVIQASSAHSSPRASPCSSINDETLLLPQQQRIASPLHHQRSRSSSPQGKRTHDQVRCHQGGPPVKQLSQSPSPTPLSHEQHGSYSLHQYQSQGLTSALVLEESMSTHCEQEKIGREGGGNKSEPLHMLPSLWPPHPVHQAAYSGLPDAPLPPLEWPLPSQSGRYELLILQQPRSHHRAHYETEGSRGAVKTPDGGHPEVQLLGYQGTYPLELQVFIGTADEKPLKAHAFYQVHRITGKTVATRSTERMVHGTKVLELRLEPKDMRVVIDSVGILKLRNADIELRYGETNTGRRNTRVRLVFRVHIPQPGGQRVSLQVASHPIECSQRSAQELPEVKKQDRDRCSVLGGQRMLLTGHNFTPDSKVVFSEITQDGKKIWEVEATVDRDGTQATRLYVVVPPYRDQMIRCPAKVNFFVINGKNNRSQPQNFTYTPVTAVKVEPLDECQLNSLGHSDIQSLSGLSVNSLATDGGDRRTPNVPPTLYHRVNSDLRAHVLTSDPLDDQSVCHQSRADLYHTTKPLHSDCAAAITSEDKLHQGPRASNSFEPSTRHPGDKTASVSVGNVPKLRYNQGGSHRKHLYQTVTVNHNAHGSVKVSVKQENHGCVYLEDVNDIIRRDLKDNKTDPGCPHRP